MRKFTLYIVLFVMAQFVYVKSITHLVSECSKAVNPTGNIVYQQNLRILLEALVRDSALQGGFVNTSVGTGSDQVYGLAWCRADVSSNTCTKCLDEFISITLSDCPESKGLVIWSTFCSLRFSNESFYGDLWNSTSSSSYGDNTLDEASVFSRGFAMMEALVRNVSDQPLMFDIGVVDVGNNGMRYGLGQCSRDLSKSDCENCLNKLLTIYRAYVLNRTGWEMLGVSCGLWYDDVRFYDNGSELTPTPNASGAGGGERWYKEDVILAFVTFILVNWIA